MLVLSRKESETIRIGNEITITVTRVAGNRVALGIDAPRDVAIVRGEIAENQMNSCTRPNVMWMAELCTEESDQIRFAAVR